MGLGLPKIKGKIFEPHLKMQKLVTRAVKASKLHFIREPEYTIKPKSLTKKRALSTLQTTKSLEKYSSGSQIKRTCSRTLIITLKTFRVHRLKTPFLKNFICQIIPNRINPIEFSLLHTSNKLNKRHCKEKILDY